MREERKEVLVVGAGPVGLWTALELASAGAETMIIDSENRTSARSYACALHPRTIAALHRMGVAEKLIAGGKRVDTIAFYDGPTRQAEIKLSSIKAQFPFLLILPQSTLENALEEKLYEVGVQVRWMHRLDSFSLEQESMAVDIEELSGTTTGYVVPHWETTVRNEFPMRVQFIVGADGHHSLTRRRLKVDYQKFAGPDLFAAYEFVSDEPTGSEVRVVLSPDSTNVLWPLPDNKWRWTFQMLQAEPPAEFPQKDRMAVRVTNSTMDEKVREYVQEIASGRAPWFKAIVKDVTWCTKVAFEKRLVSRFGQGRCWLAGDAAHQTGPVGVQSMNSGFSEGTMLADLLKSIIHKEGDLDSLEAYNRTQSTIWTTLMASDLLQPAGAIPWVAQRADRLLPCLPGIGEDLYALAAQLGLRPKA